MKKTVSLKGNRAFRRLYAKGKSTARPTVALYCRRNGTGGNRLGITVGGKLGNAVARNRVRRRLREIYRLHEERFRPGWDLVVVARSRAGAAAYGELEADLLRAAEKLGLLRAGAQTERTDGV